MITTMVRFIGSLVAWPSTVIAALDDDPLLCSCADGWDCADCQLLGETPQG